MKNYVAKMIIIKETTRNGRKIHQHSKNNNITTKNMLGLTFTYPLNSIQLKATRPQ